MTYRVHYKEMEQGYVMFDDYEDFESEDDAIEMAQRLKRKGTKLFRDIYIEEIEVGEDDEDDS